ncbi:integrator complex subunit 6 isoform X2 [Hemiscyllium ocellatum]|uniref:integrator complex subunit 6 isoform X2 n=1 Tax=Hemiscyllium ocellatum TaxID=170820 RepID=UPI00296714E1|nr:integrator complex subunit 6 isoform X2 [Hemiscyllium ocellatum]
MPILLFLIDTSASMNQRTYLGTSYLDIAKGAVEIFMKLRARDPASRGDRYMLVTFDEPPYGIKGRNPFFLEPSVIITISDGSKMTNNSGVQEELHLPLNSPLPGSELTKEPFRWDQRLFALVLRLPGASSLEAEQLGSVPSDESAVTQMCEVTGGRSYCVRTQRMLNQCLESLVQKVQSGVVINFEKTGPDPTPVGDDGVVDPPRATSLFPPQAWHSCHKLIYVRPNPKTGVPVGHWPIPESFWPDQNSPTLPPRTAHPVVRFSCADCEPMVIDKLPFDKYELEPSPLTQYILERKSPHTCWQVFVSSSGKYSDLGHPFGYLKASTTLTCVNLFVMPYNYPVLLPQLDDLFKVHKLKPNMKWRQTFENYLKTMPPYYLLPLKKALRMMGAPNLINDNSIDCGLSYSVISYLKKLSQQAKIESDRIIASVGKKSPQELGIKVKNQSSVLSLAHRRDFKQLLQGISGEVPLRPMELNMKEFAGFQIAILNKDVKPQTYRNAYDIPRRSLLDQLTRMRSNLLKTTQKLIRGQDEDYLHSIPVAQMGNYQEYLKLMPSPLREIDPDQPKRLHTFGNPFKQDKKGMMIDEADEFVAGPQNKVKRPGECNTPGSLKRRRSMSPLLRRPQTPPIINHTGGKGPPSCPSPGTQPQPNIVKHATVHKDMNSIPLVDASGEKRMDDWQPSERLAEDVPVMSPTEGPASTSSSAMENLLPSDFQAVSELNHVAEDVLDHKLGTDTVMRDSVESPSETDDETDVAVENNPGLSFAMSDRLQVHPVVEGNNAELRIRVMKEIRKPGRNYDRLFRLLEDIQGPLEIQRNFIQNTIKEAARFKRRVLIQQLERVLEDVVSRSLSTQINHVNSR